MKYLQEAGIPVFRFPEHAAQAFGALYQYSQWLNRQHLAQFTVKHDTDKAAAIIRRNIEQGSFYLGATEGSDLLACYGFEVLPGFLAGSKEEAVEFAGGLAFPVAMKIVSPQILHKSEAKGVRINISGREAVFQTFDELVTSAREFDPKAEIEGVFIQKMASPGEEVILGMSRYPVFGPLLMFGLGGIFVEVFKDVVFRIAPIGRNEARRMIRGIKGYSLLEGVRGRPPVDIGIIERYLVSLSAMALNHPEIKEMDINPLIVYENGQGAVAADSRIILEPPKP